MNIEILFGAALRIIGVLQIIRGLDYLLETFDLSNNWYHSNTVTITSSAEHAFAYLVLGTLLFYGAPSIAWNFYKKPPTEPSA